jgi:hypothetical protein
MSALPKSNQFVEQRSTGAGSGWPPACLLDASVLARLHDAFSFVIMKRTAVTKSPLMASPLRCRRSNCCLQQEKVSQVSLSSHGPNVPYVTSSCTHTDLPWPLVAAGAPMACLQTLITSPTRFECGPARLSGRGITTLVASSRRTSLRISSLRAAVPNGNVWANTAGLWRDVHAGRMCMGLCLLVDAFGVCASDRPFGCFTTPDEQCRAATDPAA